MKQYITILFIMICGVCSAQHPYYEIDAHADTIEADKNLGHKNLAVLLTKPFDTESEKTRSIFYWIAKNIDYDRENYNTNFWHQVQSDSILAEKVLQRRKAICGGYSILTKLMLDEINIENELVTGWAKGESYNESEEEPNHSWNLVKIEGEWKIMDVTWASSKNDDGFIKSYYFFTNPHQLIGTHYPENPKWTLLDEAISKEEFERLPKAKNSFYTMGFGTSLPQVIIEGKKVQFEILEPDDMIIGFILHDLQDQTSDVIEFSSKKIGEKTNIIIQLPDGNKEYEIEMTAITGDLFQKIFRILVIKV